MHVVIFEGNRWSTFAPLSLTRPVFMLGTGANTLLEKQIRALKPTRLSLWVRPQMVEYARKRIVPRLSIPTTINEPLDDELATLVSGRSLHLQEFEHDVHESVIVEDNMVQCATIKRPGLSPADVMNRTEKWTSLLDLPRCGPQSRLVDYLWELVKNNEESILCDFTSLKEPSAPKPAGPYHVIEESNLWLGAGVKIAPGVVLDASKGPILLDHHASIGPNSILAGPCYVGPYAQISPLTSIRPGTSIGMMCKVGGEVSNSIIFGYSNKAHDGYLGDSYVGKWVNLGAGTTTSNLKNTYGEIMTPGRDGDRPTGRRFLGSLIGDHARTAIGTRLMAGTYVGFSAMIASSSIIPKRVKSYTFLTDKGAEAYRVDKAIQVMQTVFARRDRQWEPPDEWIARYVADCAPEIEG